MADDNAQPPGRTAADKERSRQQSRQVSGRDAARGTSPAAKSKGGGQPAAASRPAQGRQGGGNRQGARGSQIKSAAGSRNGQARGARPAPRGPRRPAAPGRRPTAMLTWGIVGLVLVIVAVLVIVKVTGGNSGPGGPTSFEPAPASLTQEVTHIPASVFDTVGVTSSATQVTPPEALKHQPPLVFTGSSKPGVFYFGAEYCPFCAAERWALIAALSRFGTLKDLGLMQSSATDYAPNTPTFTFVRATYASPYIDLKTVETQSNQLNSAGTAYQTLQVPNTQETSLLKTYDVAKYVPNSSPGNYSFPFVDIGNKYLVAGASYSPELLQGLSRDQIAQNLNDAKDPVTQAIVASANYVSAAICAADGQQPASVCTSKGVQAAVKAMGKG
jgi:thiol-disulfide isomerase/thioredoxin